MKIGKWAMFGKYWVSKIYVEINNIIFYFFFVICNFFFNKWM